MCFIITMIGFILAFNFFNAGNLFLAAGSLLVSMFFIYLMIRNIIAVKKLREENKNDDN